MSGRRINSGISPATSFNAGNRRTAGTEDNAGGGGGGGGSGASASNSNGVANLIGAAILPPSSARSKRATASRSRTDENKKDFNPRLIFSQIVAMQCFHYVFLGLLFQINYLFFGTSITIDRIFTDNYIKIWSSSGLIDALAVILSSIVGAILLAIIVEKSKKCLDFSVTLFLIHLGFCTAYNSMPKTWDWWIVNVFGTIVMILLGEYVCSVREMSDIPLLQI